MGKHTIGQHTGRARALVRAVLQHRPARPAAPQWRGDDTQPITIATPVVRNGEWALRPDPVDGPPPWDEWLQNLPPVDGWTSTASWMAQHGLDGGAR
ncbi:hypothetical protein [Nocardia concava]|uniref:hypothetical protein n=1 Tax=Nocardia concava TaxID=257281 RepID=UPI0002F811A9|nr:hypothetical protein [Nocardia concava]